MVNDTIDFVQDVITTEMNSATDNPVSSLPQEICRLIFLFLRSSVKSYLQMLFLRNSTNLRRTSMRKTYSLTNVFVHVALLVIYYALPSVEIP